MLQFSLDPGTRAQPRNGEGAESRGRVFRIGAWLVWPDGARILFVQRPDDAWVLWCFGSGEPIRQQIPADLAESVIRGRARRRATQPPA